ncbi:MAG: tetratricopeptide repeat protein [Bacteroidales bacterium]
MSRAFHNLTAYYNFYFNAYDSYKSGIKRAESNYKFNYTLPLPMLLVGDEQVTGTVSGDMDRTINKCTMLIHKHSITIKPQRKKGLITKKEKEFYNQPEFVKWARKSWLLVGEAQTWKGDFERAKNTLEFVLLQFPNTTLWFEAQVWLARLSIITNDYIDALDRLKSLDANRRKPQTKEFKHLLSSTWAFYYLKSHKNEEAIPYVKKAIENANRKVDRLRYSYILAQILQQAGNNQEAALYYNKVYKMNPPYEMAFSIRIKLIALSNLQGNSLKKELLKLAKDEKNRDYLDQLYYTLGNIERQEGNIEKSIEYYTLSAKLSTDNNNQKGMSYLVLADYYFEKSDYTVAQAYYDSSYNALDRNFPDYNRLETKTRHLNKLVENLNTIKNEDSLLNVANMPQKERDALIAQIINNVQAKEQEAKIREQEERQQSLMYQQSQRYKTSTESSGSTWYFYNQSSLSYGQSEFQMKWGKRKLEDNWRRKNKSILDNDAFAERTSATDTSKNPQKQLSNKSPEYYLANLPINDSLKEISNQKIINAMVKVAEVYQNDLNDKKEAKNAYLGLAERYPSNQLAASAYYNLYKLCDKENNSTDAQKYRSILLSKYPQSPYALLLSNPNYVEELQRKQNEGDILYENAFNNYKSENYTTALQLADEGLVKHRGTALEPKFYLLEALCLGKTADLRTFRASLEKVSKVFEKTEEGEMALGMLTYLDQRELQLATGQTGVAVAQNEQSAEDSIHAVNYIKPAGEHLFVLLVPKRSNINQLKFNLVSFNVDYFIETDLSVNNQPLNDFIEIISVSGFKDEKVATKYINMVSKKETIFNLVKKDDYQTFIISIENFATFLNDKSVTDYLKFFKSNYSVEN